MCNRALPNRGTTPHNLIIRDQLLGGPRNIREWYASHHGVKQDAQHPSLHGECSKKSQTVSQLLSKTALPEYSTVEALPLPCATCTRFPKTWSAVKYRWLFIILLNHYKTMNNQSYCLSNDDADERNWRRNKIASYRFNKSKKRCGTPFYKWKLWEWTVQLGNSMWKQLIVLLLVRVKTNCQQPKFYKLLLGSCFFYLKPKK
jgi:hypothetical protein